MFLSDGVVSDGRHGRITKNGALLKDGGDVLLPLDEENTVFIAYSENGRSGEWDVPDAAFTRARVAELTPDGPVDLGEAAVSDGRVRLDVKPGRMLLLEAIDGGAS